MARTLLRNDRFPDSQKSLINECPMNELKAAPSGFSSHCVRRSLMPFDGFDVSLIYFKRFRRDFMGFWTHTHTQQANKKGIMIHKKMKR